MSRALNDLTPEFKPLAIELLARCAEAKIPVMVMDTLRTDAEQEMNIANGVSWTKDSRHLPQPATGLSDAIDIAPYLIYQAHGPDKLNWDAEDPIWQKIGAIGERLGLRWGGRWKRRDMGHFERRRKRKLPSTQVTRKASKKE